MWAAANNNNDDGSEKQGRSLARVPLSFFFFNFFTHGGKAAPREVAG